ncbi:MAG: cation:proton antiporter [Candidatus Magasanikbacteria bacterium]|nr:cation:proton antiporter [Candidatus Magasanikbacteria bacterium]
MNILKSFLLIIFEFCFASAAFFFLRLFLTESNNHEIQVILPILLDIAFLAILASFGSKLATLFRVTPMAGKIVLGIIAGPAVIGVLDPNAYGVEIARFTGVLFILFEAGLHFNMILLKKNIAIALKVALVGVVVSLISFALLGYYVLNIPWLAALFLGGIFTATSVGLVVEVLKGTKKLHTNMANKIIGAAIIADIIGVITLTLLSSLQHGEDVLKSVFIIFITVILFFAATYSMWHFDLAKSITNYIHTHFSESITATYTRFFFGALIIASSVAAILGLEAVLGALGIGVILSKIDDETKHQIWKKIEGYVHVFVGGFLVSIGTLLTKEALFDPQVWLYALLFSALGFFTKYVVKYFFQNTHEGHLVGTAMTIRGEVGLVFVATAITNKLFDSTITSAAFLAVIIVAVFGAVMFTKGAEKNIPIDT